MAPLLYEGPRVFSASAILSEAEAPSDEFGSLATPCSSARKSHMDRYSFSAKKFLNGTGSIIKNTVVQQGTVPEEVEHMDKWDTSCEGKANSSLQGSSHFENCIYHHLF